MSNADNVDLINQAIKDAFPADYPAILDFGREVIDGAKTSCVEGDPADLAKIAAEVDYAHIKSTTVLNREKYESELTVEREGRDIIVGRTMSRIKGIWASSGKTEVSFIHLAGDLLILVRWNEALTRIFKDGQLLANINGLAGRSLTVEGVHSGSLSISYPFWSWKKTVVVVDQNTKILFPSVWPNPNGLPADQASLLASVSHETQLVVIATLLWRNQYYASM